MIIQREVMSREEAESISFSETNYVVSVYGSKDSRPIIDCIYGNQQMFDDVDEVEEGLHEYTHMSYDQAENIAKGIMDWDKKKESTKLVVHCHAGICRSSAIMQAFLEWKFGINSPVITRRFQSGRYVPNTWVRQRMREAFANLG